MLSIGNISSNISNKANWVMSKVVDRLPDITVSNDRVLRGIKWAGEHISSPQNRLILGASALISQPFIDLHNKRVDEETRKASAARTVAKILAGTTSGFFVRYYSIKAIEAMAKMPAKNRKAWETFFTPLPEFVKLTFRSLVHYRKAIGSILALSVMVATNFIFDAPVTKFLTNKFIAFDKKKSGGKSNSNPHINITTETAYKPHKSVSNLINIALGIQNEKGGHNGWN